MQPTLSTVQVHNTIVMQLTLFHHWQIFHSVYNFPRIRQRCSPSECPGATEELTLAGAPAAVSRPGRGEDYFVSRDTFIFLDILYNCDEREVIIIFIFIY